MKALIVVTHLLGTGHLARAIVIGRAFAQAGHQVTIASGGMPAPHLDTSGIDMLQLPPLRSDGINFTRLLGEDGQSIASAYLEHRQNILNTALNEIRPDILITELFPFGRRVLKEEFIALLKEAKGMQAPPVVCASIRDILAPPSKPAKAMLARELIDEFYDAILVHSDKEIAPLETSWPVTPDIEQKLQYTGFVANPPALAHPGEAGTGEILVSAGGGDVGTAIFQTAIEAAHQDPQLNWRLLVGGADPLARCEILQKLAAANATIEPVRPDFRQMLWHAAASVSMCGYNTAIDLMQTGTAAVFVPFDDGGEVEQNLRAEALSRQTGMDVLPAAQLSPANLLTRLRHVTSQPKRAARTTGLDGAQETVRIAEAMVSKKAA